MILAANELHQKRRSSIGDDGRVSHTRAWQTISDNPADGPASALFAPGVPRHGDPGPNGTRASSIEASPVKDSDVVHEVIVEFTGGENEEIPLHPLDRPPEFSWPSNEFTEAYFFDESRPDRKPFVNAAGDPFETTWERTKSELSIQMVRNEQFWNVLENDALANTCNANIEFLDGQPYGVGTLLMALPTAQKVSEVWMGSVVEYYKVTRLFRARKDGWRDRPLNFGFNGVRTVTKIIEGVSTLVKQRYPLVDSAGLKLTKPWPLTLEGKPMPSASDVPPELEFLPYAETSWATLALA